MTFTLDKKTGRIQRIDLDVEELKETAIWQRFPAQAPENWAVFIASLLIAHIEVLKFSQDRDSRTHSHSAVERIIRNYSETIFEEV